MPLTIRSGGIMRTRTAAILLAACLAAAGCSSSSHHDTPATSTPTTVGAAPTTATPSKAELIAACVAAISAGKDNVAGGAPECSSLPQTDYYEALHEANEAAQKAFSDATDAGASATP